VRCAICDVPLHRGPAYDDICGVCNAAIREALFPFEFDPTEEDNLDDLIPTDRRDVSEDDIG